MNKLRQIVIIFAVLSCILTMIFHGIMKLNFIGFTRNKTHDFECQTTNYDNHSDCKKYAYRRFVDGKRFDLRIIVLVYDRAMSLKRLLKSLNEAEYGSDVIKLEVWIDRSEKGTIDRDTLNTAINFTFLHGDYEVNDHQQHVGIIGQWFTTWMPNIKRNEIVVFFEDDITVSKYFWTYFKLVHRKYDNRTDINGYSLQGYSITFSTKHPITTLRGPNNSTVFLFPVVGSWGFSPNTKKWEKFLDWFHKQDKDKFKPYVPGNIASRWFKHLHRTGKANTMWTMWHIYFAWKNQEYTLYCNYPGNAGLTTNWREKGLHYPQKEGSTNRLLTEWKSDYDNLPDRVPYLNLSGHVVHY